MKGDPKAILETVKVSTEILSTVLEAKKNIGPMLGKIASGLSKLSSFLPFVSIALDIFSSFFGGPDPVLEEIKSKLDDLSNKMDVYHS